MLSLCMMSAVVFLTACSSAVAAVEGSPALEPPSDPGAPWVIEWSMPDRKDEMTPKTLILCSDHMAEHLGRYRSLIEKSGVLKGYMILDGSKLGAYKPAAGSVGYIVSAHKGNEDQTVSNCVAKYPELKPLVTDFIEKGIWLQQAEFQNLIKVGILPKEVRPLQCYSRFYYPTEDHYPTKSTKQWLALIDVDDSADNRCFDVTLPATFGIHPFSCEAAGICVDDRK
ncbi:hypothetical protein HJB51_22440 [Rhizobium lentis]|uniref:hypothetical protein n=1 Tax=Rhizobium lentis TaxID=1138194 RepID=UPI001C82AF14|nr:hypothetical protein [Rhizobium lentis]MBX4954337.1 hypothetical protein [Rhizobium lentis]MBX5043141.1 hypothetical protein [Rhizobium lentis]MBX5045438.1 hypothetical protein [Rhizobium lentis]MBX5055593.1 hypothetical protein [Rhizobium lentis]MBX5057450.1 hypothetical protein [Rhizobium lentis]